MYNVHDVTCTYQDVYTLCYDTFIPLTCACHYKGRMCTFIVSRDKDTVRGLIECPSQWSVISSVNMMCGMSSDMIPLSPFDLLSLSESHSLQKHGLPRTPLERNHLHCMHIPLPS